MRSEQILARLQQSLVEDCRRYIQPFRVTSLDDRAYAFVVFVHSVHAYVGWRLFTETRLAEFPVERRERPGFAEPDGMMYNTRESLFAGEGVSSESEAILEEFREFASEDDDDESQAQSPLIDCLVSVVQRLEEDLDAVPKTESFVAFVSEYDSVDPDTVKKTVSAETCRALWGWR